MVTLLLQQLQSSLLSSTNLWNRPRASMPTTTAPTGRYTSLAHNYLPLMCLHTSLILMEIHLATRLLDSMVLHYLRGWERVPLTFFLACQVLIRVKFWTCLFQWLTTRAILWMFLLNSTLDALLRILACFRIPYTWQVAKCGSTVSCTLFNPTTTGQPTILSVDRHGFHTAMNYSQPTLELLVPTMALCGCVINLQSAIKRISPS